MLLSIRKVTLWRKETENAAGAGASVLGPLAAVGADLKVVMGFRIPGNETRAVLEVAPVSGKKAAVAAAAAGLAASGVPALVVDGDDRAGIGLAVTSALAGAGINLAFLVAQVVGRRFSAVFGFESDDDAKKAVPLIRKALAKPKPARKAAGAGVKARARAKARPKAR